MDQPMFPPSSADDELRRRSALLVRTIPLSLFPIIISMIIWLILLYVLKQPIPINALGREISLFSGLTLTIMIFSILALFVRLGRPMISALAFISMWTFAATAMMLETGIMSVTPALIVLPICAAGLLLNGLASMSLTILATVLIAIFTAMQFRGIYLGHLSLPVGINPYMLLLTSGFWISLFWMIAAMTWMLAHELKRALDRSRAQAVDLYHLSISLEQRVAAQTAELAGRAERAEALYEISRALTNTLDLASTINLIAARAAQLLHFDAAFVLLPAEAPEGEPTLTSAYRSPEFPYDLPDIPHSQVRAWRAAATPLEASIAAADGAPLAVLALPMHHDDGVGGLLVLAARGAQPPHSSDDRALATGLADQAAVAIAQAQLIQRLHESATLEERTRLAREIHDTLAQGLTGIVVQLGTAELALEDAPDQVPEHIFLARKLAREALAEARRSVWNLRSPILDQGDLVDALRTIAARSSTPGTAISFERRGEPWPLARTVESALLRVVQEALANVAKHARATSAAVLLDYQADSVVVSIDDNGVGIDMERLQHPVVAPGPWGGFGLLGMRERLAALQGSLEIHSANGTHVRATVPRLVSMPAPRPADASNPASGTETGAV